MSDDHHFWHKPVPDPDLEIRCGGVRGGGWGGSPNNNFSVLKIRGAGLPGPSPGSATANSLSIALKITCDDGT